MKFSKKVLAAFSALAMIVASLAVTSCKAVSDDDVNEMIKGSNNNYSIDFTNETGETSRGFKATTFKHSGAVVKVTINDPATNPNGVMGIIFDLTEENKKKSFNVVGLRTKGSDGTMKAYVSRFENISNINASNFGASTSASEGEAKETVFGALDTIDVPKIYDSTAKTTSVYVIVIHGDGAIPNRADGSIPYYVYFTDTPVKISNAGKVTKEDGSNFDLPSPVATIPTNYREVVQKQLAVYANVYRKGHNETGWTGASTGTFKGTWQYHGDYKEVTLEDD